MEFKIAYSVQPVYSLCGFAVPDKNWVHTDVNGCVHKFNGDKLYTLEKIDPLTETHYCCGDSWEEDVGDVRYFCKMCGEQVEPHWLNSTDPHYISQGAAFQVDGQFVSQEQYEKMFAAEMTQRKEELYECISERVDGVPGGTSSKRTYQRCEV